jgi:hypothetical protein
VIQEPHLNHCDPADRLLRHQRERIAEAEVEDDSRACLQRMRGAT